eukprot:848663-Prymnesium_polylepis.1
MSERLAPAVPRAKCDRRMQEGLSHACSASAPASTPILDLMPLHTTPRYESRERVPVQPYVQP